MKRYLTEKEIDIFFIKYLSLFGLSGGRYDYAEIQQWLIDHGKYPNCFNDLWEMPIGKMYGYEPIIDGVAVAFVLGMQVTDPTTFNKAINSYKEQIM